MSLCKRIIHSFLILQFFVAYTAEAAYFKLPIRLNLRKVGDRSGKQTEMAFHATVPKGTIVNIPDELIKYKRDGKTVDLNNTINSWLRNEEAIDEKSVMKNATLNTTSGKQQPVNFFRIKIAKLPEGSSKGERDALEGLEGYMAIENLARDNNLELVTLDSSTVLSSPAQVQRQEVARTQRKIEAGICETCDAPKASDSNMIQQLKKDLEPILVDVQKHVKGSIQGRSSATENIDEYSIKKFNSSACFGLKFDDFEQMIIQKSRANNIPPEIMLGIMTQETRGDCKGIMHELEGSSSVGLFQINTGTAPETKAFSGIAKENLKCTKAQLRQLNGMTTQQMAIGPKCLENPVLNLDAAIDVLSSKFRVVSGGKKINISSLATASREDRDLLRKALSAYNGGQKWTGRADNEMKLAAEKWGIENIDTNNWEEYRLFLLRKQLETDNKLSKYGLSGGSRMRRLSISNVGYVEAIMGREIEGFPYPSYTSVWTSRLQTTNKPE